MSKIFESPDGGKTVYEREAGSTERVKIKSPKYYEDGEIKIVTTTYKRREDGKIEVRTHTRRINDEGTDYQDHWTSETL